MKPVILCVPGAAAMADAVVDGCSGERGAAEVRRFPDGEWFVRVDTAVAGREVVVVCSLDRPDDKIAPLLFLARTARELGATRVGLVAPYLAYMRQDARFAPGEGVTSVYFAQLLGRCFDWLVTVDPHLHRYAAMDEVYSIPVELARAAPGIAAWVRDAVAAPLFIGPDAESAQWVTEVARLCEAPHLVLDKRRRGDRDVEVSAPRIDRWPDRTPVVIDDIISTATTMIRAVEKLRRAGATAPVCVGIHAVFADGAHDALLAAGAAQIVTCNTVPHPSNAIDVGDAVGRAVAARLGAAALRSASAG
jgi:ribose-phosphate pyrophosphokinase